MNISHPLKKFVKENDPGIVLYAPFDVVLSKTNVVQPDILFISKERMGLITEKNLRGAPDIAIEILFKKTRERDKLGLWRLKISIFSTSGHPLHPRQRGTALVPLREGD